MATRTLLDSIRCAARGIREAVRTQRNMRIHLVVGLAVLAVGAWLGMERSHWLLLWLIVALVWCAELLNTAVEVLVDFLSPERRVEVMLIKDIAAGAVLVCCVIAVVVGAVIFWPLLVRGG